MAEKTHRTSGRRRRFFIPHLRIFLMVSNNFRRFVRLRSFFFTSLRYPFLSDDSDKDDEDYGEVPELSDLSIYLFNLANLVVHIFLGRFCHRPHRLKRIAHDDWKRPWKRMTVSIVWCSIQKSHARLLWLPFLFSLISWRYKARTWLLKISSVTYIKHFWQYFFSCLPHRYTVFPQWYALLFHTSFSATQFLIQVWSMG